MKASVEFQSSGRTADAKNPESADGKVTAVVEDGPEGLRVFWSRALIEKVDEERRIQARDPEKPSARGAAMDELNASRVNSYLNAAPDLLGRLEEAQFVEEKADTWDNQPVRRLTYKVTPRLDERSRKIIKEIDATVRVWVGAEGLPVAAENRLHLKGRAMLVITFESTETEMFRFRHTGNRLVIVQDIKESSGSGAGESHHEKTIANVTPIDG